MAEYTQKAPGPQVTTGESTRTGTRPTTPSLQRPPADTALEALQAALNGSPGVQAVSQFQRVLNQSPRVADHARLAAVIQTRRMRTAAARWAGEPGNSQASVPQRHHTVQRVEMPKADKLATDAGAIPQALTGDWLALMAAVQRYHMYIDEYRRAHLARGSVDPGLTHDWRDVMDSRIGVVRRHAQTVLDIASERHQKLSDKLIKSGDNKTEIAALAAIISVLTQVITLMSKPGLAQNELKSVHPGLIEHFTTLNQQNVDSFIAANPDKTLKAADLAPGSVQANVNAGAINKVGLATYNPRHDGSGPIATPLTGYTKTGVDEEGDEAVSEPGQTIGISLQDPRAALRAVATYRVSELIGLGIIPRTVLTQYTNAAGKERLGQVMEKAAGSTGQGRPGDFSTKVTDPAVKHDLLRHVAVLKSGVADADRLQRAKDAIVGRFIESGGELYKPSEVIETAVYNFDWTNAVLQRDLSTLQVFDLLVGHVDRHAGNYIINYDPRNKSKVSGVKGIDNDDTFGKHFTNISDQTQAGQGIPGTLKAAAKVSKTPNLPPVLDFHTALRLLNTDWSQIAAELATYTITAEEIAATKTRFDAIIGHVIALALSHRLASMAVVDSNDVLAMRSAMQKHGRDWRSGTIRQWGPATMALQNPDDSYAAYQQAQVHRSQDPANPKRVAIGEPQYRG